MRPLGNRRAATNLCPPTRRGRGEPKILALADRSGAGAPCGKDSGEVDCVNRAAGIDISGTGSSPVGKDHREVSGIHDGVAIQVTWAGNGAGDA